MIIEESQRHSPIAVSSLKVMIVRVQPPNAPGLSLAFPLKSGPAPARLSAKRSLMGGGSLSSASNSPTKTQMLSLARGVSKRSNVLKPLSRGFAQEVSTPIPASEVQRPEANAASNSANAWRRGKIPVREDHGLYAFFRRKKGTEATGEDAYETVESPKTAVSGE